ncbi:MAG: pirin family protein [Acidimicrobiia bacterium]
MALRPVDELIQCQVGTEGEGFVVRRGLELLRAQQLDPFVHLDELVRTTHGPGQAVGTPDHPHRGFETVTYMLEGAFVHRDSLGNGGRIDAGDAQWMTAGAGIVHSEKPAPEIVQNGGQLWGLQLWVNLPAALKRSPARYQSVTSDEIPRVERNGAEVRVIAGEYDGHSGPAATKTPIALYIVIVQPGGTADFEFPAEHNVGFQAFAGNGWVGTDAQVLRDGQVARFANSDGTIRLGVPADAPEPMIGLLMAGQPINEPVARYGPFVMNTRAELQEAFDDMMHGRLGSIPAEAG